jgi:hypothetical protein
MRTLITLLLAMWALSAPVGSAFAGGSNRFALDQKWKRVQQWKKEEDQRFKALESEAARMLKKIDGWDGGRKPPPRQR